MKWTRELCLSILLAGLATSAAPGQGEPQGLRLLDVTFGTELPSADGASEPLDPDVPRKAMDAFLRKYWDPEHKVFRKSARGPRKKKDLPWPLGPIVDVVTGTVDRIKEELGAATGFGEADFWWVPHMWQTVMDGHRLTGEPRYRQLIGEVYDGFLKSYDIAGNKFNDDLFWLALACVQAHEATGEERYLKMAKDLEARLAKYEDDRFGGGIYWKNDGATFKNIPINAPYVILCLELRTITGSDEYLTKARRIDTWMEKTLYQPDGKVLDGINTTGPEGTDWSYNYGTFIGASILMAGATGDDHYLERARTAWRRSRESVAPGGIVRDEGHGDGCGFKMIYARYLARMALRTDREELTRFLTDNARTSWDNRRQADDLMGYDWSNVPDEGEIESFSAASGVAIQLFARMIGN